LGSSKEMFSSNDWPKVGWPEGAWPKLGSLKIGEVSVVENGVCDVCGQANRVELLANSKQLASKIDDKFRLGQLPITLIGNLGRRSIEGP